MRVFRALVLLGLSLLLTGCAVELAPVWETAPAPEAAATVPAAEPAAVPETEAAETAAPQTEAAEPREEQFLLSFVGDCTLGEDTHTAGAQLSFLKTVGDDYDYPFRNVEAYFEEDDLTLINLEGTLSDTGFPVEKKFRFRGPEAYVNILKDHSVDAVSLANNHTMDYGKTGYENTCRVLEEAGIPYVERDSSRIITTDRGLTVGLYGAVYYSIEEAALVQQIRDLRQQADLVIFVPHWGTERSYVPTAEQVRLAHAAIDAGADLVCGSHPHVLQNMERYGEGLIFYSLGNFCFGGNIYPEDYDSVIWQQQVIRDPEGRVRLGDTILIPVSITSREDRNNFQPTPYAEGSEGYERVLQKLRGE